MGSSNDKRIEDILKHLDGEIERGAVRMSVIMDENSDEDEDSAVFNAVIILTTLFIIFSN